MFYDHQDASFSLVKINGTLGKKTLRFSKRAKHFKFPMWEEEEERGCAVRRERIKVFAAVANSIAMICQRLRFSYRSLKSWLNFTPQWLVLQFLEYSRNIQWNIPYSTIFNILVVMIFFGIFVEYS